MSRTGTLPAGLNDGSRGGVFYLHGEDEFRKKEAARALVELHLDPSTADFNLDRLRGSEVEVETLASILATPPMMAEWRVVVLQETESLASSSRARDVLVEAARNPPPGLALLLLTTVPRGSGAKFYKNLKKHARSVEFETIAEHDVPGWLMSWAEERHGVTMDEEAARMLGTAVGTDLGILAREMEKLASLVGDRDRITLEDVRAAGTRLPKVDRWEWFDQVGERRFDEALRELPTLLSQRESGVGLTIGLGTHLLRLGVALEGGKRALEATLPPHQRWLARRLSSQARRWVLEDLEEAISDLRRLDRLLKSSRLPEEHLLGTWLLERWATADSGAA